MTKKIAQFIGISEQQLIWVLLIVSSFFLVFFRARYALTIYSSGDDSCYVDWLYRLMGSHYETCEDNFYSPGIALIWLPAGILAQIFSWITSSPLTTWIPIFIGFTSYLCWIASFLLIIKLFQAISNTKQDKFPIWQLLVLLNIPLIYYTTHRTTIAHAGELVIALSTILLLLKRKYLFAILFACWLAKTRINDAPILAVVVIKIIADFSLTSFSQKHKKPLIIFASIVPIALCVPIFIIAFYTGYNGVTYTHLLQAISFKKFIYTLFGADWGMAYTAIWWLITMPLGLIYFKKLSWLGRGSLLWVLFTFTICMGTLAHGSAFAHRYAIGSYAGALVIWLEVLYLIQPKLSKLFKITTAVGAVWLTYLVWIFKTKPNLTMEVIRGGGWNNPTLQIESLKTLLNPIDIIQPIGLSPPATLAISTFLPNHPAVSKYALSGPPFWTLLITTLIAVSCLLFCGYKLYINWRLLNKTK